MKKDTIFSLLDEIEFSLDNIYYVFSYLGILENENNLESNFFVSHLKNR